MKDWAKDYSYIGSLNSHRLFSYQNPQLMASSSNVISGSLTPEDGSVVYARWKNSDYVLAHKTPSGDMELLTSSAAFANGVPPDAFRYSSDSAYLLARWVNVTHTDAEIRSLLDNPWQIIGRRERRTFIAIGAGGNTLNATATGGAAASGAATLEAQIALAAVGVALAGGAAQAGVSVPLSAAGIAVSGGSATGTATVQVSAAGLAQAAGQAGLSASVLLAAAGAAQSSGNASLAAQLAALASGSAEAGGAANLTGGAPGEISAAGSALSSGAAALSVTVQLAATGTAQAAGSATGTATAPGQIAATGSAQAAGGATVSVTVQLTAAGFVQAMGVGQFSVHIPITASGGAISAGLASLSSGGVVRVVASCRKIHVAAETRRLAIDAEARRLVVNAENRRVRVI